MKELMIHVETIVRPLHMSDRQKLRVREELLGHVCGIYDEELERVHDHDSAVSVATKRFGQADELSQKLQSAVPCYDIVFRYPRTAPHLLLLVLVACVTIEIPALTIVGGLLTGHWFVGYEQLAVWGLVMATLPVFAAYGLGMAGAYYGICGLPKSRRRMIGYTVAFFAYVLVGSLLMNWPHPVFYPLYAVIWTGIVAAFAYGCGHLLSNWEFRLTEWDSLMLPSA